jgi:hypothetical protein
VVHALFIIMKIAILSLVAATTVVVYAADNAVEYPNEIKIMPGHQKRSVVVSPLPHT